MGAMKNIRHPQAGRNYRGGDRALDKPKTMLRCGQISVQCLT